MARNFDPDWSQEEFDREVMLADRFDVIEFEAAADAVDPDLEGLEAYEAEESFAYDHDEFYDYEPSPYDGTYSEM